MRAGLTCQDPDDARHIPEVLDVTVQVVKTSIMQQLAPADCLWEAETEPLHPAGQLHMRR